MRKIRFAGKRRVLRAFTLIELLTVIAIIAILAALTLYSARTVMGVGQRSRTTTEIQGISSSLENYKADNGSYPLSAYLGNTSNYTSADGGTLGNYQYSSELLYQALTGKYNLLDTTLTAGSKSYITFKTGQLGNLKGSGTTLGTTTYLQDPFGYSYGYNTGAPTATDVTANPPNNGIGNFDLWSTGGTTFSAAPDGVRTYSSSNTGATKAWITNWK